MNSIGNLLGERKPLLSKNMSTFICNTHQHIWKMYWAEIWLKQNSLALMHNTKFI